ncbi:hypothetical protein KIW84_052249 [Lathyrus oleraceus]|uniref:Uncharacterized protein n=1 Tax=Pisum sativum TaxID=3888 RepID=A0A9D4WPT4_PEA|nr:hypothetical protein KIW84_052249 [Pisum sativum]
MTKSIRMLNNGSDMLDEILQVGKGAGNLKGTDVEKDVGVSSQQNSTSENMEDIESNIEPARNESDASTDT